MFNKKLKKGKFILFVEIVSTVLKYLNSKQRYSKRFFFEKKKFCVESKIVAMIVKETNKLAQTYFYDLYH